LNIFNKFAKIFIQIYTYIRVKGFLLVVFSNVVGWFECGLACLLCTHTPPPQVEDSNENLICFNLIIMFQKTLKFKQIQVVLFVVMDDNNQLHFKLTYCLQVWAIQHKDFFITLWLVVQNVFLINPNVMHHYPIHLLLFHLLLKCEYNA